MMVGGDASVLERVRPMLAALAAHITHMGPVGAGQATKAVNQIMAAGINQAVTEALAFARAHGLPMERVIEVVGSGAAGRERAAGSTRRMVVPSPGELSTSSSASCAWAIRLTMARPSPVPPNCRVIEASAWSRKVLIRVDITRANTNSAPPPIRKAMIDTETVSSINWLLSDRIELVVCSTTTTATTSSLS